MSQANYTVGMSVLSTIRSWTLGKSKGKGTPYVKVVFNNYIDWTGWITRDAMENTIKQLKIMGFTGQKWSDLKAPNALNTEVEFACTIDEVRQYNGKNYYSASWINNPSATGFTGDFDDREMAEFDAMDIRAYMPQSSNQQSSTGNTPGFTADDIPF